MVQVIIEYIRCLRCKAEAAWIEDGRCLRCGADSSWLQEK